MRFNENIYQKESYLENKISYVDKSNKTISIIGGSNIDITGISKNTFKLKDSNPGNITYSFGGVARNIAENLTQLNIPISFISVFGDDSYGKELKNYCKNTGLNISESLFLNNHMSSIYLSILDDKGELVTAISQMNNMKLLNIIFLEKKIEFLKSCDLIILDTNLSQEVLDFLSKNLADKKLFIDLVSSTKALKIKKFMGRFHTIKPNKLEAEILSGIKIENDNDLQKVTNFFLDKGVQNIVISLGKDGVFWANKTSNGLIKTPVINTINVNGAGDSFFAGLVYGNLTNNTLAYSCTIGTAAAIITIQEKETISKKLSLKNIENTIREYKL